MKRFLHYSRYLFFSNSFDTVQIDSYSVGEFLKFRIHYGLVNAGHATLEVKDAVLAGKKCTMW